MKYLRYSINVSLVYYSSRSTNSIANDVDSDYTDDLDNNDIVAIQKIATIENAVDILIQLLPIIA